MTYMAYNKKAKTQVCWLGITKTKKKMKEILRTYEAPKHVVAKKLGKVI